MFIETREKGKIKKHYLVHSFREGKQVVKLRRYLGQNLSTNEIEKQKKKAEIFILEQLKYYKEIRDPLKHILSEQEIEQVKKLETTIIPQVFHLNQEEWLRFSEVFAYNTNAIEGSELTQKEVINLIEKGKAPNKNTSDITEAEGVVKVIGYICKIKEHLSLDLIRKLHELVFNNSKSFAGKFREKGVEVVIRDGNGMIVHRGVPSEKVILLLEELIVWYRKNKKKYPALLLAAVVHNQFENIHPFQDGNGRVGRLLIINILIKNNLPPLNIEFKHRQEYYGTLRIYEENGNIRPTLEFMLKEYKNLKEAIKR